MIVQTMCRFVQKKIISRLKIGGAMAMSLVAMATATLILFIDVVFELIEERIWFIYNIYIYIYIYIYIFGKERSNHK